MTWKVAIEARLTGLLEKAVADPTLRGALLAKVADKRVLVKLLQKAESPAELNALLEGRDAAAAERLLDSRAGVRTRLSQLRATHGAKLDADPVLTKQLAEAEEMLKDAAVPRRRPGRLRRSWRSSPRRGSLKDSNAPVLGVVVDENKFTYIFGKAAPDAHNTPRTVDNARHMGMIGFHDTAESRAAIRAHLERIPNDDGNIVERLAGKDIKPENFPQQSVVEGHWGGQAEVRESLLQGPGGSVKLRSTWEVRYGVRRLTTVIPMALRRSARPIASHHRYRGTVRRTDIHCRSSTAS